MSACGHDMRLISALADGELDATHALEVEARIAACADCAAEYRAVLAVRAALSGDGVGAIAPAALRARLMSALAAESAPIAMPRRAPRWAWAGGGAGVALAACVALVLVVSQEGPTAMLESELTAAHVRSLQAAHLTDVPTSDQHVVKPWFNGRLDYAPPVIDLVGQGFPLVGGRLDYVGGRPVAAIVYRRGRHTINLFVWPASRDVGAPSAHVAGYGLRHWTAAGMSWWAVSDVNPADLTAFETLLKARTS